MTHLLPPHYGHGVCGERFWPREALCAEVLTALRRGECVRLFGPRRTGKSSLLKECARRLRAEDGYLVVEVNAEGLDGVATLFEQFVTALPMASRQGFVARVKALNVPGKIERLVEAWVERGAAGDDDRRLVTRHWGTLARAIAELLPTLAQRPVLLVDELAYLCENLHSETRDPVEVRRLLGMLREWRGAGLGMAMAGSIGIRQFLRRIDVPRNLLTGCMAVQVGPLDPDDAAAMLAALAAHGELDWWDEATSRLVIDESTDLLPSCLQFAFRQIEIALAEGGGADDGQALIRQVFRERIRPHYDQEFHQQFDERLGDYDRAEQDLAREVFACIARSTSGSRARPFADLIEAVEARTGADRPLDRADLDDLVQALADDGFLYDDRDRDRIGFASRLVEGWWRTRDHRRGRRRRGRVQPPAGPPRGDDGAAADDGDDQ
jgi:energy-coupling factor transporter ATP-binding protein EcfA2